MDLFSFDSIISKKRFEENKRYFLLGDVKYSNSNPSFHHVDVDMNVDDIEVHEEIIASINNLETQEIEIDEYSGLSDLVEGTDEIYNLEVALKKKNFYKDYLIPEIKELPQVYIKHFDRNVRRDKVFSEDAIRTYGNKILNQLDAKEEAILSADHLNQDVIDEANKALQAVVDYISYDFMQKNYSSLNKIPLNLNKIQVITLFHLLIENKIIRIKEKQKSAFFRKVEQSFQYFDSDSNSFKDISNARKYHLKYFNSKPEKFPYYAIEYLEKIFTDDDFFDI